MVGKYDGLMVTPRFRRAFRPSNHITILPLLVNVLDMPGTKKY